MGNLLSFSSTPHKQLSQQQQQDDDFVLLPDCRSRRRLLLIFDIDGTLSDRIFLRKHAPFAPSTVINDRYKLYPRPDVNRFLDFCMNHPNLDVAVWGNIVPWNLEPIVQFLFPEQSATRKYQNLKFIWSRDQCDSSGRKSFDILKQNGYDDLTQVLLIDDSEQGVADNLKDNTVFIPRYRIMNDIERNDNVLQRLQSIFSELDFTNRDARELAIMIRKKLV